jgi:hypothetical protein
LTAAVRTGAFFTGAFSAWRCACCSASRSRAAQPGARAPLGLPIRALLLLRLRLGDLVAADRLAARGRDQSRDGAMPTPEATITEAAAPIIRGRRLMDLSCIRLLLCALLERFTGYGRRSPAAVTNETSCKGLPLRPHVREKNYIADRRAVGQQHHQPVDAEARAAAGGMPYSSARM